MTKLTDIECVCIQQVEKTVEQLEDERAAAEDRAELPDFTAMAAQQVKNYSRLYSLIQYLYNLNFFLLKEYNCAYCFFADILMTQYYKVLN